MIRLAAMLLVGMILTAGCSAWQQRPEACTTARGEVSRGDEPPVSFSSEHCVAAGPADPRR